MFYGAEKCCKIKPAFGAFGKGDFRDRKKREKRWSRKEGLTQIGNQHLTRGEKVRQDAQKTPKTRRTKFVPTKYRAAAPNIIATTTTQRRDQTSPAKVEKKSLLSPTPKIRFLLPPPPPPSSIETDLFLPLLACLAFPPFIFQLGKYRMTKDRRDQKKNPPPPSFGRAFKEKGEEIMIGEGFEGRAELVPLSRHTE